MARHSKWHKVKQFKGAIDARRAASFTKLAREITVAVREKGADPSFNYRLRTAIERARESSMPKESIERAIERGAGGAGEGQIESLLYEGYGSGGTAFIIECLTDNRNRTANDVKHLLTKSGGALATPGAVVYLFDRVGVVLAAGNVSENAELELIDAGASDLNRLEGETEILCSPNDVQKISDAAVQLGLSVGSATVEWSPKSESVQSEDIQAQAADLAAKLEELDDVQRVTTNAP